MPSIDWDSITNIFRRQSPQRKRHIRYGSAAAGGLLLGFGIGALCGGLIGALAGALIVSVGGLVYVVYRSTRTPTTPAAAAAAKAPHTARMNKAPRSSVSRAATPVATPIRQSSESRLQALDELRKQIVDPLAADIETLKQSIAAAKQANKKEEQKAANKKEEQKQKVSEEEEQKEKLPEPIPVPVSDVTSPTTATVPRPLDLLPTTTSLTNSPPNSPPVMVEAPSPLAESVEECGIDRDGYCCFGARSASVNVNTRPQANPRNCAESLVAAVADVCSDRASTSRGNSSIANVDTDTDTKLPGVVAAATEDEEEDEDEAARVGKEGNLKDKETEDEPEDFVVLDEDDEEYVFLD